MTDAVLIGGSFGCLCITASAIGGAFYCVYNDYIPALVMMIVSAFLADFALLILYLGHRLQRASFLTVYIALKAIEGISALISITVVNATFGLLGVLNAMIFILVWITWLMWLVEMAERSRTYLMLKQLASLRSAYGMQLPVNNRAEPLISLFQAVASEALEPIVTASSQPIDNRWSDEPPSYGSLQPAPLVENPESSSPPSYNVVVHKKPFS